MEALSSVMESAHLRSTMCCLHRPRPARTPPTRSALYVDVTRMPPPARRSTDIVLSCPPHRSYTRIVPQYPLPSHPPESCAGPASAPAGSSAACAGPDRRCRCRSDRRRADSARANGEWRDQVVCGHPRATGPLSDFVSYASQPLNNLSRNWCALSIRISCIMLCSMHTNNGFLLTHTPATCTIRSDPREDAMVSECTSAVVAPRRR